MNEKYVLFPFDAVSPHTKIAIYGAGEIFTNFEKQIQALNYCKIAWIIDKKFNTNLNVNDSDTAVRISPHEMPWNSADYIIIASIAFAHEIEQDILKLKGNLDNVITITKRNVIDESFKSNEYWNQRYITGLNSGPGSYNHLAKFKANTINDFISKNNIKSIIEFGCGDGNQLRLVNCQNYLGFDISLEAISLCKDKFKLDKSKEFKLVSEYNNQYANLALSLDVIFHLVEDDIYEDYMHRLFSSASKYIIIYSSNSDVSDGEISTPHVKHRKFSTFIEKYFPDWILKEKVDNPFIYNGDYEFTSFCDFYIYIKS